MATGPLIVIVGPTASGKTDLAIHLAKQFDGEIICADSRTVYKGLSIGTAKPTPEQRAHIPHHLLDVVAPCERFTVADFKRLAGRAIDDILGRGKVPIMAGGSGLYIDAVLYDYQFAPEGAQRDPANPRHIKKGTALGRHALRENTLLLGLRMEREVLKDQVMRRVDEMVNTGLIDEVRWLLEQYPASKAADAPGYKAFRQYLDSKISLSEAKALFVQNDMQLAKRQLTWFKRNNSIHWIDNRGEAVELATTFLNKRHK